MVKQYPIIIRFMKGVCHLRPVLRPMLPAGDLSLVLDALREALFEPLEQADMKIVSYKTAFLALTSINRIGELHASSSRTQIQHLYPSQAIHSWK